MDKLFFYITFFIGLNIGGVIMYIAMKKVQREKDTDNFKENREVHEDNEKKGEGNLS